MHAAAHQRSAADGGQLTDSTAHPTNQSLTWVKEDDNSTPNQRSIPAIYTASFE